MEILKNDNPQKKLLGDGKGKAVAQQFFKGCFSLLR